jgi:SMI1-KNR4 cell-wall
MRLTLYALLLKNLKGEIPQQARREFLPKEEAHKRLKELSGCSFSIDDIASWLKWVKQQRRAGARRITSLLQKIKSRGHDVWEAGPATTDAIQKIEEAIGGRLPRSYVSFLLSHGALCIYDNSVSGVTNGDRIRDGRGTALSDTETLRSQAALPAGFLVVGPHEDGACCLDLTRRRSDGECPVVNYEMGSVQHEKPVANTFEDWLVEFRLKLWSEQDA